MIATEIRAPAPSRARQRAVEEFEAIEAELARRSLRRFVGLAWPIVEPNAPLKWNWHLDVLCSRLEAVTRHEVNDLIVNIPPGCMKSLLVSVFWPAWEWATDPALRYLCASYGQHLSTRDNLKVRDIVTSPWYQKHYRLGLRGDQNAKTRFDTYAGGWRIGTSIGGPGTGEHPHRKIVDDPHSESQARSDAEREEAIRWVDGTLSTRGTALGAATVLVMQRLHQKDMTGHFLDRGGFEHVMFPMRFEPERADLRDKRKIAGELLWPALFPEVKVRDLELRLNPYGAAGQLQQRPAPEGGGLFKRAWFPVLEVSPAGAAARRCRGWDTAATPGGGDWTAGVRIADAGEKASPRWIIEDVVRGQWGPADVDKEMLGAARRDGRGCRQREEREPGSAGVTVIAAHTRLLAGFDHKGAAISGDKVVRAGPLRAQAEAGNVGLVRGPWNEAYLSELENFPNGEHDDQVDGSSCGFNDLASGPQAIRMVDVAWG